MKAVVVVLLCASIALGFNTKVPDGALLAVRGAGIDFLASEIRRVDTVLENAVNDYNSVKTLCEAKLKAAEGPCISCVEQKCRARAESVCKPEKWQEILGKTIGVFKDKIPDFFSKTIPDVFVNKVGGGVVDIAHTSFDFIKDKIGIKVVDLGKKIGSGVVDTGLKIKDGVVDVGKKIGDGVVDVGKKIGDGVVDVGKKIGDGVVDVGKKIGSGVVDVGKSIGGFFKGIFGKRSLIERKRRTSEPDCGKLENDPQGACQVYVNAAFCSDCGFSAEKSCPGYSDAVAKVKVADEARSWILKISDQNYNILEMMFDPRNMREGAFTEVSVKVQLFGKEFSFTVNKAINPYIPDVAGPIIAEQALNIFKSM